MDGWPDKSEAERLLEEWTKNKNLRKHAYAVEAAMRAYAAKFGEDPEKWGIVGLLHDFDYEKFPTLEDHPFKGVEYLKEQGYSDELTEAILAHAEHTGTTRDTILRPSKKLADVKVRSVRKKWKEKTFAAGVDRGIIERGAEELGVELTEHIDTVIKAMQGISEKLGL
ncbi:MAG: HD domain-containing protein [Planctomycetota bacterium]|jgi:putative nucleotidyltransferase with HDIG domain